MSYHSQIYDLKQFAIARHSFSLFGRIGKTSESVASLSLVEQWMVTEIRRQLNSALTYCLPTNVLLSSIKYYF